MLQCEFVLNRHFHVVSEHYTKHCLSTDLVVLGQPYLGVVLGDSLKQWLSALLQRTLYLKQTVSETYRCDGPDQLRECQMLIEPQAEDLIRISHFLLNSHSFESEGASAIQPKIQPVRCSWCCRLSYNNRWLESIDYAILEPSHDLKGASIGICPACAKKFRGSI